MKFFKNKYEVHFCAKQFGDTVYSFAEAAALALEKLDIINNHPLHDELAYMEIIIVKWHWLNRVLRPHKSALIFWSRKEKKFMELKGNGKCVEVMYKPIYKIAA